jgi:nitrile hydratase
MGGVDGFGPVCAEKDEPVFHAEWERRAFALTLAMARPGGWNLDMSRFVRENRSPMDYLSKSYYQIWLAGLERLMIERGLVSAAEIDAGRSLSPPRQVSSILTKNSVADILRRGGPAVRPADREALFSVGDRVRAKNLHPTGHTRLPRYVRGHVGVIELIHGCHVLPDSNSVGAGENPQWLYTVRFDAAELWGDRADPRATMSVDAWEPYLEREAR